MPADTPPSSPPAGLDGKPAWIGLLAALLVLGVPAYGVFTWVLCRIEVPPAHVVVLTAKTGTNLPSGQIVATEEGQKGIQLDVLQPGRHFRNPLFWDWDRPARFVDIGRGEIGVLIRQYGDDPEDLEQNLLVPRNGTLKGIVEEVLTEGQYALNPRAFSVEKHPVVEIPVGYVGVVCNRVGRRPQNPNEYLVDEGERGIQRTVLRQGDHRLNPYQFIVYPVDVRSHRLELSGRGAMDERTGSGAVRFPSSDGFEIEVHLTVEWSVDAARAPEVFVRIGGGSPGELAAEILRRTLIPALRGNARIMGSKHPAVNYIAGELREEFQEAIFERLRAVCATQGVLIHNVLVNDVVPPQDIAGPIRERVVAREELARNQGQEQQAKAEQRLARETALVGQETEKVKAETEMELRRIKAQNAQAVALIQQEQLLAVAKADLAAAELQAEAILARGQAAAAVIVANNQAEAHALRASAQAFRTPAGFASYTFAQRMAPSVRWVFADPGGPFGRLFQDLLEGGK